MASISLIYNESIDPRLLEYRRRRTSADPGSRSRRCARDRPYIAHSSLHRAQLEDQLRIFPPKPFFPRQTRSDELGIIDVPAVIKIDIMEELLQLVLVGGDREQGGVVAELLGGAQRHQSIAELRFTRTSLAHVFESDHSIVRLVEVLERVAQLHQLVLPRTPLPSPTLFRWYATAVSAAFFR